MISSTDKANFDRTSALTKLKRRELPADLGPDSAEDDGENFIATVSKKIDGAWVHVDGNMHPNHYKAILLEAKSLKLQGFIDYDQLKSAARRYILSVQTRCKAKGLKAPRMNTASLVR